MVEAAALCVFVCVGGWVGEWVGVYVFFQIKTTFSHIFEGSAMFSMLVITWCSIYFQRPESFQTGLKLKVGFGLVIMKQ